jgi:hypothetical protein
MPTKEVISIVYQKRYARNPSLENSTLRRKENAVVSMLMLTRMQMQMPMLMQMLVEKRKAEVRFKCSSTKGSKAP